MSLQESMVQAEKLAAAFQRRADALKVVAEVDAEIDTLQSGMASTEPQKPQKKRGRPAGARGPGRPPGSKAKRGPGRPPGSKSKKAVDKDTASTKDDKGKRFRNKQSMKELIVQIVGRSPKRGVDLDGIVTNCQKAGFKSTSTAKGYVQNVRTNLNGLMNAEPPVIVKTEDKRYFLKEHFDALPEEEEANEEAEAA